MAGVRVTGFILGRCHEDVNLSFHSDTRSGDANADPPCRVSRTCMMTRTPPRTPRCIWRRDRLLALASRMPSLLLNYLNHVSHEAANRRADLPRPSEPRGHPGEGPSPQCDAGACTDVDDCIARHKRRRRCQISCCPRSAFAHIRQVLRRRQCFLRKSTLFARRRSYTLHATPIMGLQHHPICLHMGSHRACGSGKIR
jgi:hypothetical protein